MTSILGCLQEIDEKGATVFFVGVGDYDEVKYVIIYCLIKISTSFDRADDINRKVLLKIH